MSFLFGGGSGRKDPELAAAARRRREAFAADIGDERARAFAHVEPRGPNRRTGLLLVVLVVFAGLSLIPVLRGPAGGLVEVRCDQPAVGVSSELVAPGGRAAWQASGPDTDDYVVALDSTSVRPDGTVEGGRVLAGPIRLDGCASAQTLFDAPTTRGPHQVTLFRRTPDGYSSVASDTLRVG